MCWKYKNPHDEAYIWCEIVNGEKHWSSYLRSFIDGIEDYYDNYDYCPYCGKKLEVGKGFLSNGKWFCTIGEQRNK